ncbi:MAG: N-acetyltransferase [Thermodesulfobacteriota bacterium]
MHIREALESDLKDVLAVERAAFGSDEEAALVGDLLTDDSAKPLVSLLALNKETPVGHILFTRARLEPDVPLFIYILAPLAVVPEYQKAGMGKALVEKGLKVLSNAGAHLVFVLGHPSYYPRFGFKPAGVLGFKATYPILEKNADAWMVQELVPDTIHRFSGKVICADVMHRPEYWVE